MTEAMVREKWTDFCEAAKALVDDGYRVQPGRTLNEPVSISETGAVKKPEPETKATPSAPKTEKRVTFGMGKKSDSASE